MLKIIIVENLKFIILSNLAVNIDFIDDNISLAERLNQSKFYLISNKLIIIYCDAFLDYDKNETQ